MVLVRLTPRITCFASYLYTNIFSKMPTSSSISKGKGHPKDMLMQSKTGSGCTAKTHLQPQCQKRVNSQHHGPAALTVGKNQYPLYRRLGGPWGQPGCKLKNLTPTRFHSPQRLTVLSMLSQLHQWSQRGVFVHHSILSKIRYTQSNKNPSV